MTWRGAIINGVRSILWRYHETGVASPFFLPSFPYALVVHQAPAHPSASSYLYLPFPPAFRTCAEKCYVGCHGVGHAA